ncbi:MAG: DNA-3-methyladenine glycosylase [Deltaproteobacteria bacterium]|nr:DNA-3-methyladenine glycosylase [Deltaproteobacteria bacterium]
MKILPREFYLRPTAEVARDLLGRVVVAGARGKRVAIRLVEVEAYLGIADPAAHTFRGRRTERVRPMWGPGGHAYVYFTYGMHHCLNAVTRAEGRPEAVLIRAGEPVEGVATMRRRRGPTHRDAALARGPACVCVALGLDRRHSGLDLTTGRTLWIEEGEPLVDEAVATAPRVGVDYAGDAAAWPLRFLARGHPSVSKPPRPRG